MSTKLSSFAALALLLSAAAIPAALAQGTSPTLYVAAGHDRDVVMPGKTYLNGYAGYSNPAARVRTPATGPTVTVTWSKQSGPGNVAFESASKIDTTATFSKLGAYVLKLHAANAATNADSSLTVNVVAPPPKQRLDVVYTTPYSIDNPLWNDRAKSLIADWIPHCIDEINQPDLAEGGINNFIQAGKRLARDKQVAPDEKNLLPSQIIQADVQDYTGLANKLAQHTTSSTVFLWSKLDPDTQSALSNNPTAEQTRKSLVANLNRLLIATNLYDAETFKDTQIRTVTFAQLRQRSRGPAPSGERLAYINRLLLEDVFPTELAQVPQKHIGYPFANAWVHQTVESMCIALMVDAKGDPAILKAQQKMRETLDQWIPIILAAQESDGYLQTRFTLGTASDRGPVTHWNPATRGEHEGYVAGYFIESAINHYTMTGGKDTRLYDAAKKLADCWVANLGPGKKVWYDGHQEMEQALVRFGRFVNDMEGHGRGDAYVQLAKFLLDSRASDPGHRDSYDQSDLPVTEQYVAEGHAVRATYTYSGMADVAAETGDLDYQSAVLSIWDDLVNRKYYLTGGIGSGETSEGFGPDYSLRNNSYCESCSTCGLIFFQYKMNLAWHDAKYADLYEDSLYNALLGATDEDGLNFNYTNPLQDGRRTPWHNCPCCVGNIPRTLLMIPTWTYVRGENGLYVNLFIGSAINVAKVAGKKGVTDVQMVQKTDYPWNGNVSITVNPKESQDFTLYVRVPDRHDSALYQETPALTGLESLTVNGKKMKVKMDKGYAVIDRKWKTGDKVDFVLPLQVQRVTAVDKVSADHNREALRYGPLIYNVERADNVSLTNTIGSGPLTAVWKPELLHGVMAIQGAWSDGTPFLAIPHYARNNRPDAFTAGITPHSEVWFKTLVSN